ncbi:cation:proton antiporter [Arenibaculum sp.]|uniref:cation:proton antiporter n=1 Tax=Arenibaculum sp. TaxID=2865862 RepID=UPI002E0DBB44|nr:cation:proton antiporter [Arenibaculum sp.]
MTGGLLTNPLMLFIAQAVAIIGASQAIGLLTRRIGQPMVIAEVVAGIMLGPSLLGAAFPEAQAALFPSESMPLLHLFSQIGLIFFMFLIGLELDPDLLRGRRRSSALISGSSIVVPFALGALLALYLYPRLSDGRVGEGSFMLFMGVAMSITAFPVLARILTERGMLRSKIGSITIACAAVGDVAAWCILAFVVSFVRVSGVADAAWTTLFAGVFIGVMVLVVRPVLARLGRHAASHGGPTRGVVASVFLLVLASAWTTELIGIHALFGAFLLGAVMPRDGGWPEALIGRIEDMAVVFLLPLFFAHSGLHTQFGLLGSLHDWITCALIVAVACAAKFGATAAAARLTGLTWRESSAVGILMNTRGLIELIVLNLGLDLGIISPLLFTMMVIMVLVTTFMTTPLLGWAYPPSEVEKERRRTALGRPALVGGGGGVQRPANPGRETSRSAEAAASDR